MACVAEDSPCFIAGDDLYYDITFTDSEGVAKDLTGATALMDLRDSVTSAAVVQSMSGGVLNAIDGQMRFALTDVQTAALLPRAEATITFVFSVKLTYADATEQTILVGSLTLEQAATA